MNNPLMFIDPTGLYAETLIDVAAVSFSLGVMISKPSWANAGYLALDVVSLVLPVVAAAGTTLRAANAAKRLNRAADVALTANRASTTTDLMRAARTADNATNAAGGARNVSRGAGSVPVNHTPTGAGRSGAFNAAKRDIGIPRSEQPTSVLPNIGNRGEINPGRNYIFRDNPNLYIRDDVTGHIFRDGGILSPHFNTPSGRHFFYGG